MAAIVMKTKNVLEARKFFFFILKLPSAPHSKLRKGRAGSNQESVEAAPLFTTPPLASVGLTEQEAKKQGINYKVDYEEMTSWFLYKRLNEPIAAFKVLLNKDTDQIIGAHLLGHHAEEIINIFAVAVNENLTGSQLEKTIFSYLTNASDIVYML